MSFWAAMVLITLIISVASVIGGVLSARYKAHAGIGTDAMGGQFKLPAGQDEALKTEVEQLRERLKVLERIATDDRHPRAIAEEIESLRDR